MNEIAKKIYKLKKNKNIQVGLDIGGTLTKIAIYISKSIPYNKNEFVKDFNCNEHLEFDNDHLFIKHFQTNKFNIEAIDLLKRIKIIHPIQNLHATGGGAYKFHDLMNEKLNVDIVKHDELTSLVNGYSFMNHLNTFYEKTQDGYRYVGENDFCFPHIAVNIGSGVSVLRVDSGENIKRITGSLMGGGTLIGLSKLLINVDNYNDILTLAKSGDNSKVDLMVGDIYGGHASNINLDRDVIASSFGKVNDLIHHNKLETLRKEDIAKSLLSMICFHISQLAFLVSKQTGINKIYYFGNFTKKDSYAIDILDYTAKFWDKDLKLRFNKYDGNLGSIGTLID